ncbi:MAG: thiamine-phosphate kinase [Leptospiraceae bacterium]|nr:thiamine-phosphate kinase [Leptospiraceae bacterium]MDW7975872.1 thiamine-phosphate kinase [Leptospiraceae bacterium]
MREKLTEEEIIKNFTKKSKNFHNDDCEVLPLQNRKNTLITCDTMVENTHFRLDWHPPNLLAKKLFHVNLSDIISSGGVPKWCLIQIGIPKNLEENYIMKLIKSFRRECEKFQCEIIGGDTFASERLTLSLTMIGYAEKHITRQAKPNSYVYVTGNFGLSLLGYKILNQEIALPKNLQSIAIKKHLTPKARFDIVKKIYPYAISMMDVSDGLYQDLTKMAKTSGYEFVIYLDEIPIHPNFKNYISFEDAFISGEEYELIFTTDRELKLSGIKKIGYVSGKKLKKNSDPVICFLNKKKYKPQKLGYLHFD